MQASLKIVIVDESPTRAAVLEDALYEAGHTHVVRLDETSHLIARICGLEPDVVLIDLGKPSRDKLEEMFAVSRAVKRPVAMFVDQSDRSSIEAAIDAGVSAYVVDGMRKERIKATVWPTTAPKTKAAAIKGMGFHRPGASNTQNLKKATVKARKTVISVMIPWR